MLDAMLEEYNVLEAELQKKREELAENLRPKFGEAFAEFFSRYPGLEEITFTAYTPYFNDGDECVYGVNEAELTAYGIDELSSYDGGRANEVLKFRQTGQTAKSEAELRRYGGDQYFDLAEADLASLVDLLTNDFPKINEIITSTVPEEVMKAMFGDHSRVTITRDGVEAEEYEHE